MENRNTVHSSLRLISGVPSKAGFGAGDLRTGTVLTLKCVHYLDDNRATSNVGRY
jgi:hypothetical protein